MAGARALRNAAKEQKSAVQPPNIMNRLCSGNLIDTASSSDIVHAGNVNIYLGFDNRKKGSHEYHSRNVRGSVLFDSTP